MPQEELMAPGKDGFEKVLKQFCAGNGHEWLDLTFG